MELKFLGRGAAFNPKEGNTSAYFIDRNQLFLIDCGESVYKELFDRELLDHVDAIHLMITHTHSDHIGSVGSLILHSKYKLGRPINIILPEKAKHLHNIESVIENFGCSELIYRFVNEKEYDNQYDTFSSIRYVETDHCDALKSYGLIFDTENGIVYYSGDSRDISLIQRIIDSNKPIDKLYLDTTTDDFPGNPHLNIGLIEKTIPEDLKKYVYCMHINNDNCIEEIEKRGFQIVKTK